MTPSDWMAMTPSEWMNMATSGWTGMPPSDWMNRAFPGLNRSYSDWMNMKPSDWWAMMSPTGMRPGAWTPAGEGERYGRGAYHRHGPDCECEDCRDYSQAPGRRHDQEGCRGCGSDSCDCYCCLGDVDLAVYALLGEQRVVPIVVENERHREAQISLELSAWTTSGGATAPVETLLLEPKTFTLPSCGEQKITLVVRVLDQGQGGEKATEDSQAGAAGDAVGQRQPGDVDTCRVATADLRLVGCDHRPLRLAVAILPRSCDPYRVSCGCACC